MATLVAVNIAFYFGLSLPRALGVTKGTTAWFDLLLTAVIIGAGTKPLHDLITTIQSSGTDSSASASGSGS